MAGRDGEIIPRNHGFRQLLKGIAEVVAHPIESLRRAAAAPPSSPPPPPRPPAPPSGPPAEPPGSGGGGYGGGSGDGGGSGFDWTPVNPDESGIPPGEDDEDTYAEMLDDMGLRDDDYAADALWTGWFDLDATSDRRLAARQAFFDFTGLDDWDFDWDAWREWYGEAA